MNFKPPQWVSEVESGNGVEIWWVSFLKQGQVGLEAGQTSFKSLRCRIGVVHRCGIRGWGSRPTVVVVGVWSEHLAFCHFLPAPATDLYGYYETLGPLGLCLGGQWRLSGWKRAQLLREENRV